jgi:hypothetical protein
MMQIKTLAPKLNDALNAVELGCHRIQNDSNFVPNMRLFMAVVSEEICVGCLATCTLMQLTNKTGKDILNSFSPSFINSKNVSDRANVFGIDEGYYNEEISEFSFFEAAIDSLRHNELFPLLKFYGLEKHKNAAEAIKWFVLCNFDTLDTKTTKKDLLTFADFIKNKLIPKIQDWFE